MRKLLLCLVVMAFVPFIESCNTVPTGLKVEDCTFYVSKDVDICLTYEIIAACSGLLKVVLV